MERGRSGSMDHESIGEVRRALDGMTHDATEGHRLLHTAYERDGAIGPIQTLETFSRSHRATWSSLRDRLPFQLTDISDKVSSVFEAMDQEVAPLKSLLPRAPGTEKGAPPAGFRTGGAGLVARGARSSRILRGPGRQRVHEHLSGTLRFRQRPGRRAARRRHGRPAGRPPDGRHRPVLTGRHIRHRALTGRHPAAAPPGPAARPGHRQRGRRTVEAGA